MIIQLYIAVKMWQVFSFLHILVIFIDEIYDSIILCYYCWLLLFCLSNDSIFPNHNDISIYILYIPQIQYSSHFFFFFGNKLVYSFRNPISLAKSFLLHNSFSANTTFQWKLNFCLKFYLFESWFKIRELHLKD